MATDTRPEQMSTQQLIRWTTALREAGLTEGALLLLEKAGAETNSAEIELMAAWAALESGHLKEFEAHLSQAIALQGETYETRFLRAAGQARQGSRAYPEFAALAQTAPYEPQYLYATFVTAAANDYDWEAALTTARQWCRLTPDSPLANEALGAAEATVGDPDQAVTLFRRAEELAPNSPDAKLGSAEILLRLKRRREAGVVLAEGMKRWPEDERFASQLVAAADVGRPGLSGLMYYVVAALASAILRPVLRGAGLTTDQAFGWGLLIALVAAGLFHVWVVRRRRAFAASDAVLEAIRFARSSLGAEPRRRMTLIVCLGLAALGAVLILGYLAVGRDPTNPASRTPAPLVLGVSGVVMISVAGMMIGRTNAAARKWKQFGDERPAEAEIAVGLTCVCRMPSPLTESQARLYARQHLKSASDIWLGARELSCQESERRWVAMLDEGQEAVALAPIREPSPLDPPGPKVYSL